jgi:hypothetical protein
MAQGGSADRPRREPGNYGGEISGLGLSDIIQLNAQNGFSGCIDAQYQDRRGLVFLRDGAIVHAEFGSLLGEAAFHEIMSWPGGRFVLQENVATTRPTIQKSCDDLIREVHRLVEERRAGRSSPAAPPAPGPAPTVTTVERPVTAGGFVERLRKIPGVAYAVLQKKDGARLGDDSYQAEVLAGQAIYLEMAARQLGACLQVGDHLSAVVQGTGRHLVFFVARSHLVTVLVDGSATVGEVEAEVRKLLAPAR